MSLQYLVTLKNCNYLNINAHLSKWTINYTASSYLKITSLTFNAPDMNPLDYHVWGAILGCYTRQIWPTLPSLRLPCYRYGMICHRISLIKQCRHFETSIVCCCSWRTLNPSSNAERAACINYWNVWSVYENVVQSLIGYHCTRMHVHWKSEL